MASSAEANLDIQSLSLENTLTVEISDALSERDKVKYTVHTKTNLPEFTKKEISVVREHEEFIWLHHCLDINEHYAGFIIPPSPPRPDFNALRERLQKLCTEEQTMTKENFSKMKQELEQEYLANFKKTVAMHEMFLCRLATHPVFMKNFNFRAFLEGDTDLSGKGKTKKEVINVFIKRISQSVDEVLLSGQRDVDDFFEREKNNLLQYYGHLKEATVKADKVCLTRKDIASSYANFVLNIDKIGHFETNFGNEEFGAFLCKMAEGFDRLKKCESRVGSDEELKEADTMRYFTRELQAGKELLYRRLRCLANYENANKDLERARLRNREAFQRAEFEQIEARKKFIEMGILAKSELTDLKKRRVEATKKNLAELADLEVKQSKVKLSILKSMLESIKETPRNSTAMMKASDSLQTENGNVELMLKRAPSEISVTTNVNL